jgi:uncharacterized membrane protein YphA (DoxX/SURF4 family)
VSATLPELTGTGAGTGSGRRREVRLWVSTAARLILGGVLVAAGALKAVDPLGSVRAVTAYELLPPWLAELVGYGLPFLEIGLGALLLLGFAVRLAATATTALMIVFIAGVASAWARGLSIDCGCFGGGGQISPGKTQYVQEILRDLGYLVLAGWLIRFPESRWALDRHDPARPPAGQQTDPSTTTGEPADA